MNVIAVDAMGGDNAPEPEVRGAVAAVDELPIEVILVGDEPQLRAALQACGGEYERIRIRHASEVVTMDDQPTQVFRRKTDSSMRVAFDLVAAGEAHGVVSAGNSGAVLSHGTLLFKRIPGVERPGIVAVLPSLGGTVVLCDTGANVEVKPTMLAQFGIIGACYDRIVHHHARPRVGVLSNGAEDSKGTALTRSASELLRAAAANPDAGFEFEGYVEASEIFAGGIDVVATDGFTGNVVLKLCEGLSEALFEMMKGELEESSQTRLGGMLARPALRKLQQTLDYSETGGALLAGVNGVVMLCHGRSDDRAIRSAIRSTDEIVRGGVTEQLALAMAQHLALWQRAEQAG